MTLHNLLITALTLTLTSVTGHARDNPLESPLGGQKDFAQECEKLKVVLPGSEWSSTKASRIAEQGVAVRVHDTSNGSVAHTLDFRPDRLNVAIKHGKVQAAHCG